MPNIKASIKSVKADEIRRQRNRIRKSLLKTSLQRFQRTATTGDAEKTKESLVHATRALDKSAAKGIIHKNNAARHKSKMAKRYNQVLQKESPAEE